MHIEFHNFNPKKEKAADCIYLTEARECQNKKSPHYLAKCFAASYCTFKVKAKDAANPPKKVIVNPAPKKPASRQPEPKIQRIECTLPLKCPVYSDTFGEGEYTGYNANQRIIEVTFDGTPRNFVYPDAVLDKYLYLPAFAFKIVLEDVANAEKR